MRRNALPPLITPKIFKTTPTRSMNMAAIRSRDNATTEQRVVTQLRKARIGGWRRHIKTIGGTPDLVFPKAALALFIDGCYWHGCPRCGHVPKTNTDYWSAKLTRNTTRDRRNRATLRRAGYRVMRIWEHELKDSRPDPVWLRRLRRMLET